MGQKMNGKMKRLPMKMRDLKRMRDLMRKSLLIIYMALTALALASCGEDALPTNETATDKGVEMKLLMSHPSNKAPTAPSYFEAGDKVGIFVSEDGKPLEVGGNVVNNEALTFNGNEWTAAKTLYWNEGLYNVYAYHPYIGRVSSIEDQPFSVSLDQRTEKTATALGGYKASDLLFATSKGVRASDEPVQLAFRHIMSKITIRLVKGEDFEGKMPKNATVYVHNTVTEATIDLQAGVATRHAKAPRQTITAHHDGDNLYSAIVVPQRIENRMPFIEVIMNNMSYLYESKFLFKPGMEHFVNLIIPNNPNSTKIEIGGGIKNWE